MMISESPVSRLRVFDGRSTRASDRLRLGLVCDFAEENWPSMDLVADMLEAQLQTRRPAEVRALRIQPPMAQRLRRLPFVGRRRTAWNGDRLLARFLDYPRILRRQENDFDCFH